VPGSSLDCAFELAAGGVDVAATGAAEVGGDSGLDQGLAESFDCAGLGHGVGDTGAGVPGDEIDLGGKAGATDQAGNFAGVFGLVGDAAEEDVFERDSFAGAELYQANGIDHRLNVPLVVDGHKLLTDLVVGSVEADGQLGTQLFRLLGEALDSGDDARGGDGHALGAEAGLEDEQADGRHEVVVVEERLSHPHEDQVDSVAADFDFVTVEDGDDLAGDFAGGEVALEAEFGGETELTVDSAADLAGDADGGALPTGAGRVRRLPCLRIETGGTHLLNKLSFGAVAGFAVVAFGHPDGFDGLDGATRSAAFDQITLGSIDGLEDLLDDWAADLPSCGDEFFAKGDRQCCDFT